MQPYSTGDEPIPGYRLARFLGAGSYGQVWAACSPSGIDVALKILSVTGTRGGKELRAIGLVKRLRHPNLVPLHAYWVKDEFGNTVGGAEIEAQSLRGQATELIIAMGLGDKSLAARLDEARKAGQVGIPVEELLRYMDGAANAIDYLNRPIHELGSGQPHALSHCDIKPANLLIVGDAVQVCDYGLARAITPDVRATAATGAGTQAYSSPEMLANRPSEFSDQYSLAISYYELRVGQLPFPENEALHAHITGRLDFSLISPAEQAILKRATQLEPKQRFPTAGEFLAALREALKISGGGSGPPAAASSSTPSIRLPMLDDKLRAGGEIVPDHTLVRLLGRGGYGEVWEARGPGRLPIALKIVRNLDGMQGKQEWRSLDLVKELDHERLIRLRAYWLLQRDGTKIPDDQIGQPGAPDPYALVMATDLAVKSLLQYWQEFQSQGRANIPVAELMRIIRQSAEAIDYLNERDITHRDIKPENILLTKDLKVKVSDFGLAKVLEGSGAAIHQASVGLTLAYAAPELFDNRVSRWTDQYALALTYYRLRTGNFPFPNDFGPRQMMMAHTEGRLEFAGVRPEEERVLRKATSREPLERYPTCLAMVEDLEHAHGLSATNVGGSKPSDFKIPSTDQGSGVRLGLRGDDPRKTLIQELPPGAVKTDSRTEPFVGSPAATIATDSQVMAELVESASVKDTPRGPTDLQATVIPDMLPVIAKHDSKPKRGVPTPNVEQIIQESRAERWKRVALIGGTALVAIVLAVLGYSKFGGSGSSGTASGGSQAAGSSAGVGPGDGAVRSPDDELRADVAAKLSTRQFAAAAAAVAAARKTAPNSPVADELDKKILTQWRADALGQTDLAARTVSLTAALAAYPSEPSRPAIEATRLELADDLAETQIDQKLSAGDFTAAGRDLDAALASQRIRPSRAERVRQSIAHRWIKSIQEQTERIRQIPELPKRIEAWTRLLESLPTAALRDPNLRAARTEVLQEKVAAEIDQFRQRKDFGAAAAAVKSARTDSANADWADRMDDLIRVDWRAAAEAQPTPDGQLAEYDRLLAVYPNDAIAKADRQRVQEGAAIRGTGESIARFRALLKEINAGNLANVRGGLRALASNKSNSADLQRRIENLLARLDEFEKDARAAPDLAALDALSAKYDALSRSSAEELRPVADLYREQCDRVAQAVVRSVNDKTDWSKVDSAARRVKTPWTDALRAEAVNEKLAANLSVPAADRALPTGDASGDLAAYREYIAAVRQRDADAAARLAVADAAPWRSPYRNAHLLRLLQESVDELKAGGSPATPFTDAETAYKLLSAAEQLASRADAGASKEQVQRLRLDLAVAAMTMPKPDLSVGRKWLNQLVSDDVLKGLRPADEVQVRILDLRSRDGDKPAERQAALRGFPRVFELLRKNNLAGLPVGYLDAELIRPLERDRGRAIIGAPQSPADKALAARVYVDAARLLTRFRGEWAKERGSTSAPIDLALKFLDTAVALDPSAENLAWRGLTRFEQDVPNLALAEQDATAALAADKSISLGHTLRGIVSAWRGWAQPDLARRVADCAAADEQFQLAERLALQRPDSHDELVLLYKNASKNDVQLANFVADPKSRDQYLDRAIAAADKLLALDPSRLDMCDTKGCALEDKAWLLAPPDRFAETGAYRLAVAEFTKALGGLNPRATAQMHRGRCLFKLAEDRVKNDRTLRPDALSEILSESKSDLSEAIGKAGESSDALEAHYWRGKIEMLRYQQPSLTPAQREQAYQAAASDFREARRIADKLQQNLWAEPITLEWALASQMELARLERLGYSAKFEAQLKEASELADSAKRFSKPWYAYLRMELLRLERLSQPKNKQYYADLASRADDGLGDARLQDRQVQYRIRTLRSESRSQLDTVAEAVDPVSALKDAEAALDIAKSVPLSPGERAAAHGLVGLARVRAYLQLSGEKKEAAREKPRDDFRKALDLAPQHPAAWQWNAFLGMTTKKDGLKEAADLASYVAEAYPHYRAAEEAMPKAPLPQSHEAILADHVRQSREKLEKEHRATLEVALRDKPDHPDRAVWQLSLAEMQARAGEAAAARDALAAALKALPPDSRKKHDAQIRRIELLLKK